MCLHRFHELFTTATGTTECGKRIDECFIFINMNDILLNIYL